MNISENIKQRLAKFVQRFGAMALVAVASSAITYYVCQQSSQTTIAELQNKIKDIEKLSFQARVMQRVSSQMEDIAFQQKEISDSQKVEALRQQHIADVEKNRAEFERGLARQAERKAVISMHQADSMREVAQGQTLLATQNMLEAERQKSHADTLFYLSMANSLAQSSLAMGTSGSDLSRLLSFAAWTYNKEYGGDLGQVNIYRSLLYSSNAIHRVNTMLRGNVRDVDVVKFGGKNWAMGLTDYGEVFFSNDAGDQLHYNLGDYAFREMVRIGDSRIIALSADGRIVEFTANGEHPKVLRQTKLSAGVWKHICKMNDGMLAVMSDHSIVWIDSNTLLQKADKKLDANLLTMGYENSANILHLFGADNRHFISDGIGQTVELDLTAVKEDVTAYTFDSKYNCHVLGTESGKIYVVDASGKIVNLLSGHSGRISAISLQKDAIVSTSYDKTMRFWSLDSRFTFAESMEFPIGEWALSFVVDEDTQNVWLGGENGNLDRFSISAARNAERTQSLLHREFTESEWDFYMGSTVPYRTFMKGGKR